MGIFMVKVCWNKRYLAKILLMETAPTFINQLGFKILFFNQS